MITLAPYGFYWFQLQQPDKSQPVDAVRGTGIRNPGGAAGRDLGLAGADPWRVRTRCAARPSGANPLVSGALAEGDPSDADVSDPVLRYRRQPALAGVFRDHPARHDDALCAADADRVGALRPRALQPARLRRSAPGRARRHIARCRHRPDLHRAVAAQSARIADRRGTAACGSNSGRPANFPTGRSGSRSISARSRPNNPTARRWSTAIMSSSSTASSNPASIPRSRSAVPDRGRGLCQHPGAARQRRTGRRRQTQRHRDRPRLCRKSGRRLDRDSRPISTALSTSSACWRRADPPAKAKSRCSLFALHVANRKTGRRDASRARQQQAKFPTLRRSRPGPKTRSAGSTTP